MRLVRLGEAWCREAPFREMRACLEREMKEEMDWIDGLD